MKLATTTQIRPLKCCCAAENDTSTFKKSEPYAYYKKPKRKK